MSSTTENPGSQSREVPQASEAFRAKYPKLWQAMGQVAVDDRDRVAAHVILGDLSGAREIAVKAIEDGSELTEELQAKYLASAHTKGPHAARAVARMLTAQDTGELLHEDGKLRVRLP